jgi:protein O-GlcNAc transferase
MLGRLLKSIRRSKAPGLAAAAMAHWRRNDLAAAERGFRLALAERPFDAAILANLGLVLLEAGSRDEALALLRRACEADPADLGVRGKLARALVAARRVREGIEAYRELLRRDPGNARARAEILQPLLDCCEWTLLEEHVAALTAAAGESPRAAWLTRIPPFASLALPLAPDVQREIAVAASAAIEQRVASLPRPVRAPPKRRARLRIGYVSSDFYHHATAHLAAGLFELHDRDRFELFAYCHSPDDGSDYRRRLIKAFDHFDEVRARSFDEIAARIAHDEIDILVDLKGHTGRSRLEIFALRPAPVQLTYLGFPGTLGAAFIDYAIADAIVVPDADLAHFTENVVRLAGTYQVNDRRQPVAAETPRREALGLPQDAFVFCSFCRHFKIEPVMFAAWMRILAAVPESVLWLLQGAGASRLREAAAQAGIDPARLVFAPGVQKAEHLARHRAADLMLDTRLYNGHTTTSDALWTGLPVVTCPGASFASRVSASLLRAIDVPEGVTTDLADYERSAIALARDATRLMTLKRKLEANRLSTALFDTEGFTRRLERAYLSMWERHLAGQPAAPFDVD